MTALLAVLVGAPTLAAAVGLPAGRGRRGVAAVVGIAGCLAALVAAALLAARTFHGQDGVHFLDLGVVDLGTVTVPLVLRADPPAALVAVAVAVVALGVQVYSAGYLRSRRGETAPLRYAPYAATISLFTAAMLAVVTSDDLFTLIIGWEVMAVCSYLLIGHHSERQAARRAALQAFLVTRVGDIGFLLGIVVLYVIAGTTRISEIVARADQLPGPALTTAGLLLLAGVVGKSAQFPLFGWLPDAMEGPTPVSALIHAATMVAAGVVVLVRLGPLYDRAPAALATLAVISSLTMIGGALAAFVSGDLKRVLAWSTVSQIAVMLAAVSLGSDSGRAGALAHLISHSGFKALLFLLAGIIALRLGTTKLEWISDLRRRSPWLTVGLAVGLGSLAALPPLTGFVSKEGIISAAFGAAVDGHTALAVWAARTVGVSLVLTTLLTGLYAARLYSVLTRRDLDLSVSPEEQSRRLERQAEIDRNREVAERAGRQDTVTVLVPGSDDGERVEAGPDAADPAGHSGPGPDFRAAEPGPAAAQSQGPDDGRSSQNFVDDDGELQDWDLLTGASGPGHQRPITLPESDADSRLARLMRQRRQESRDQAPPPSRLTFTAEPHAPLARPGAPQEGRIDTNPRLRLGGSAPVGGSEPTGSSTPAPSAPGGPDPVVSTGEAPAGAGQGQRSSASARSRLDRKVSVPLTPRQRRRARARAEASGAAQQVHATLPLDLRVAQQGQGFTPPPSPAPKSFPGPGSSIGMRIVVIVLTFWTVLLSVLPFLNPVALTGYHLSLGTMAIGVVPAVLGVLLGFSRGLRGSRDLATRIAAPTTAFLASGYGYQAWQRVLVMVPTLGLARLTRLADGRALEALVNAPGRFNTVLGARLARVQTGQISGYLSWLTAGAVVIGGAAVTLAGLR